MAASGTESFPHLFEELSDVMRHGSISFGRYADDLSAWDKRSVFTYNRCQEELEKCKSPGSVAQKKAYFDEYYKNRVLKELPVHQQETNQFGPSQEKEEADKLIGNGVNASVAVKEDKPNNVSQIHVSDDQGILMHKESPCLEVKRRHCDDNDATMKKRMNAKQSIDEEENHFDEASVSYPSLPEVKTRCVQGKSIVSSKLKQTITKTIKHGNNLKDKGTVASVIANKAKVRSVTTKDDVIKSRPNPSLRQKACVKVDKSVPSMKDSTPNVVRNISRKTTEPHSSLPRLSGISKISRLVPSCSGSSIKKAKVDPSSKLEQSRTKLETRSPLPSRSSKSDSKNIASSDGLRTMSNCTRSRSCFARENPNHTNGVEQNRSYNKERKDEERKEKVQAGLKRDAKQGSTRVSCTNKASDKLVPSESADLKCDRAALRGGKFASGPKRPIWR